MKFICKVCGKEYAPCPKHGLAIPSEICSSACNTRYVQAEMARREKERAKREGKKPGAEKK